MKADWVTSNEMQLMLCENFNSEKNKPLAAEDKSLTNISVPETNFFILDLTTQAGTYVKEFVHGDFGRTKPSVCEILDTEVDIVALDVMSVNLNWP